MDNQAIREMAEKFLKDILDSDGELKMGDPKLTNYLESLFLQVRDEALEDMAKHFDLLGITTLETWTGFTMARKIRSLKLTPGVKEKK